MYSFCKNGNYPPKNERKIFMKKYLYVILALTLSFCLLMTGCGKGKADANPTDTSAPGTQSDTVSTAPTPQTPSTETPKTQVRTGTYVCEYGDYIFYRNTNDNGSIYRYNIKDDSYIRLFDKNAYPFLHSITVFDEHVYFVTQIQTDLFPSLYRISVNGGEYERLIENISEDFCITNDAIYYTCDSNCPDHNSNHYQLHKYTFADKKSSILFEQKESIYYYNFNLIGDKIYFLTFYSGIGKCYLTYFDTKTQNITELDTIKLNYFDNAVSSNDGKIIYLSSRDILCSYNTETQEFKEIVNNFAAVIKSIAVANDNLVFFYSNQNGVNTLFQYKDGVVSNFTDTQFERFDVLEIVDNKPIMFNSNNTPANKILGDERLNKTVEDAKTDALVPTNAYYVMTSYYGMTINDVIEIWGTDYKLNDYLISGGLASIEYTDNRCSFRFCYDAVDIPTSCNGEEKLTCIIARATPNAPDFFVTEDINTVISYNELSQKIDGKYYIDELNGGYSFDCNVAPNMTARFGWHTNEYEKDNTSVTIRLYFSY